MKKFFFLLLVGWANTLWAQIHAGGKGDGYASVHLKLREVAGIFSEQTSVLPSMVSKSQELLLREIDLKDLFLLNPITATRHPLFFTQEGNSYRINLPDVPQGIYYFILTTHQENILAQKILILP